MMIQNEHFFERHPDPETKRRGLVLLAIIEKLREHIISQVVHEEPKSEDSTRPPHAPAAQPPVESDNETKAYTRRRERFKQKMDERRRHYEPVLRANGFSVSKTARCLGENYGTTHYWVTKLGLRNEESA